MDVYAHWPTPCAYCVAELGMPLVQIRMRPLFDGDLSLLLCTALGWREVLDAIAERWATGGGVQVTLPKVEGIAWSYSCLPAVTTWRDTPICPRHLATVSRLDRWGA